MAESGQSGPPQGPAGYMAPTYPMAAQPQSQSDQAPFIAQGQPQSQMYPEYAAIPQVIQPGQSIMYAPAAPPIQMIWTNGSQIVTCPYCHVPGQTIIRYEPGAVTWISCLGICLLGGWVGCCLIPFCIEPLQDCIHTCSSCGQVLGKKTLV